VNKHSQAFLDVVEHAGLLEDLAANPRCKLTRPQLAGLNFEALQGVQESLDRCATMRPAGRLAPLPDIFAPEEGKGR